jgi:hypothetical protein
MSSISAAASTGEMPDGGFPTADVEGTLRELHVARAAARTR